ncbi:hypothetical protein CHU98_g2559 [Xylaria longipes]|nr:hypothetical protein CHU98_g2559 [Xylaria longipes]
MEANSTGYGMRYARIHHSYWIESNNAHNAFADTILIYQAVLEAPAITKIGKGRLCAWAKNGGYVHTTKAGS